MYFVLSLGFDFHFSCRWSFLIPISLPLRLLSSRLLQLQRSVLSPDSDVPDELLYGRAGYLYALLYVNKEMGPDTVDETTVAKVCVVFHAIHHPNSWRIKLALIKMHYS